MVGERSERREVGGRLGGRGEKEKHLDNGGWLIIKLEECGF